VNSITKLIQRKTDEYANKRYKDNQRLIMKFKELWALYVKSDEIKWSIDTIDKIDVEIFSHIITDFSIISAIRLFSDDVDPDGKKLYYNLT